MNRKTKNRRSIKAKQRIEIERSREETQEIKDQSREETQEIENRSREKHQRTKIDQKERSQIEERIRESRKRKTL